MPLPPGTRAIRITLECHMAAASSCDGFVDLVSLTVNGGANLVSNTSFETDINHWAPESGAMARMSYASAGIASGDQPPGGGTNLLYGWGSWIARSYQVVDVSAYAESIDAGAAEAELSAWMGGYSTQGDFACILAEALGASYDSWELLGPSANDRSDTSKMLYRSRTLQAHDAHLPVGTRTIRIWFWGAGNDSLFDVVSLTVNGGSNLVTNPSAETDTSGWTASKGSLTRWTYAAEGISPPPGAGTYTFSGNSTWNEIYQDVDVSAYASQIDAGAVTAHFSCYMGGYNNQQDRTWAVLRALDGDDNPLDEWRFVGPTNADRGGVSAMLGPYEGDLGGYEIEVIPSSADYPVENDVREGVEYGHGVYEGTLVVGAGQGASYLAA